MECSLFDSIENLIAATEPEYSSAAVPRDGDEEICDSPDKLGQILHRRVMLKMENNNGVSASMRALNLLWLDSLAKYLQAILIILVIREKGSHFLEDKDPMCLKVTQERKIIYRAK